MSFRTLISTLLMVIFNFGLILCIGLDVHSKLTGVVFCIQYLATAYFGYFLGKDLH